MTGKSLALGIVIGGGLSASFNQSFKTAKDKTSALGEALRKTGDQKQSILTFKILEKKLGKTATAMKSAQVKTADLGRAMAKSEASIKKLQAEGAKTGDVLAKGMDKATDATMTWNKFTSQRMSKYMKELGGHAPAIKKIGAEWKVYKKEHGKAMSSASKDSVSALGKEQKSLKNLQREFKRSASTSGRLKRAHRQQRGELRTLRSELRGAGMDVRRLGDAEAKLGRSIEKTRRAMERQGRASKAKSRFGALKARAIGSAGAVYGVGRLVGRNAAFEHELTLLANTGSLTDDQKKRVRKTLRRESVKTNQGKSELLSGVDFLVGKGFNVNKSVAAIGAIGKAATASGASIIDLSKASFSMMDNMKLSEKELGKALDIIASSGKQGGFELRGMAQFFPVLTAQAQVLGLEGKSGIASIGAALQIAMKGAGSESEAANNLQNFLSKITSKETVTNLQKLGVSVKDVFDQAQANGSNPLIDIVQAIQDVVGNDSFALNKIFGDIQVKNFLNPMLANMDAFDKIYQKSLKAQGVNAKDFAANMKDTSEKMKHAKNAAVNLGDAFAQSLKPAIDPVLSKLGSMGDWAAEVITEYPVIGQIIGGAALGFVGLTTALGLATAAQWAWNTSVVASSASIVKNIALTIVQWGSSLITIGSRILPLVATGIRVIGVAMMANPIGAALAALATGAYLLYDNWESVTSWFGKKLDWLADKFSFIGDAWNSIFGDEEKSVTQRIKQTIEPIKKPAVAAVTATMLAVAPTAYAAAASGQAQAGAKTEINNSYQITIQAAPGADGAKLAEQVMREIKRRDDARSRAMMGNRESDL